MLGEIKILRVAGRAVGDGGDFCSCIEGCLELLSLAYENACI